MPVRCYRVGDFQFEGRAGDVARVETYSIAPWNTNLQALLALIADRVVAVERSDEGDHFAMRYRVIGGDTASVTALLAAHGRPTVTLITDADLAVATDFYNFPPLIDGFSFDRTGIGDLIRRAKYNADETAKAEVAWTMARLVQRHPVLSDADVVVPMPGHAEGVADPASIAAASAREVSRLVGIPVGDLVRTQSMPERKNTPSSTQAGSMQALNVEGMSVIVVDDAIREGDTLQEACRALRGAGAQRVYGVVAAKDWTGTRGYRSEHV